MGKYAVRMHPAIRVRDGGGHGFQADDGSDDEHGRFSSWWQPRLRSDMLVRPFRCL